MLLEDFVWHKRPSHGTTQYTVLLPTPKLSSELPDKEAGFKIQIFSNVVKLKYAVFIQRPSSCYCIMGNLLHYGQPTAMFESHHARLLQALCCYGASAASWNLVLAGAAKPLMVVPGFLTSGHVGSTPSTSPHPQDASPVCHQIWPCHLCHPHHQDHSSSRPAFRQLATHVFGWERATARSLDWENPAMQQEFQKLCNAPCTSGALS